MGGRIFTTPGNLHLHLTGTKKEADSHFKDVKTNKTVPGRKVQRREYSQ